MQIFYQKSYTKIPNRYSKTTGVMIYLHARSISSVPIIPAKTAATWKPTNHATAVFLYRFFLWLIGVPIFFDFLRIRMSQRNSFLFREFVIGADSFGQLSCGIPNRILSGLMYWLIVAIVLGILFILTGWIIVWSGYQVGKIYRKYCWDILSIIVAITSTAIAIYFGEWIKSVISINLITLLLLVHMVYIGIRCYVKERGHY